jgi:hypothetical protein
MAGVTWIAYPAFWNKGEEFEFGAGTVGSDGRSLHARAASTHDDRGLSAHQQRGFQACPTIVAMTRLAVEGEIRCAAPDAEQYLELFSTTVPRCENVAEFHWAFAADLRYRDAN